MWNHGLLPGGGGFRAVPEGRPSCWLGRERKQRAVRGGSTWAKAGRRRGARRPSEPGGAASLPAKTIWRVSRRIANVPPGTINSFKGL